MEITCKHGTGIASVVCGHHLEALHPVGFIENSSDPANLQAWCYACEYVFAQEDDLTERFQEFNKPRLVCEKCYAEFKSQHSYE